MRARLIAIALCALASATAGIGRAAAMQVAMQVAMPRTMPRAAPADEIAGGAEIAALSSRLEAWALLPGWPKLPPPKGANPLSSALMGDPCPEISLRLALFRTRFGGDFREAPGWKEFSALAARLHARLLAEYPAPPPGELEIGTLWIAPAWLGARALLLDLAGCHDEARELLFGDVQRSWDGCCVPDLSQNLYALDVARGTFLDRAGDTRAALLWYHEAFFRCEQDGLAEVFGRARGARDLLLARYAILLANGSELDAARSIVRLLRARDAETVGYEVAMSALRGRLEGDASADTSVFAISLGALVAHDWAWGGDVTAFVVGDRRDSATWRILGCSLPRWPERAKPNRMGPDCGTDLDVAELTDPRVATLVQAWMAERPRAK